jgi:PIN domain nuclease of toxin-antitoxin system
VSGLLLDTCALIWLVSAADRLSGAQQDALSEPARVAVSALSAAEIACLQEGGRIVIDRNWKAWFDHYTDLNGIAILGIDYATVAEACSLPEPIHRDPCDRIIIATARRHGLRIITGDRKLIDYPFVETIS